MTIHFKKISLAGSDTNKLNESLVEPKPHLYVVGTLTSVNQQTTKLAARPHLYVVGTLTSVNQQTTKLAARQTNRLLTPRFADFHARTV